MVKKVDENPEVRNSEKQELHIKKAHKKAHAKQNRAQGEKNHPVAPDYDVTPQFENDPLVPIAVGSQTQHQCVFFTKTGEKT